MDIMKMKSNCPITLTQPENQPLKADDFSHLFFPTRALGICFALMRIFLVSYMSGYSLARLTSDELNEVHQLKFLTTKQIFEHLGAQLEFGLSFEKHLDYLRHFDRVDTDSNGNLTKWEFVENGFYLTPQARRGIFHASDENKDGLVSQEEYVLNRVITDEAKWILQGMDDDQNCHINRAEFFAHTSTVGSDSLSKVAFEKLDTDQDGILRMPEYLRAWGALAREGQQPAKARMDVLRQHSLDNFWSEVSRTVREGDFEGYAATCHPEGVLVSGVSNTSYPLTRALARWKQGFTDTKSGLMDASVEFRFGHRRGDATSAHEQGIFRYKSKKEDGEVQISLIHFEALLVRKDAGWKVLMEYQKSAASGAEWEALASTRSASE